MSKDLWHNQVTSKDLTENSKDIPEIKQKIYNSKSSEDKRLDELDTLKKALDFNFEKLRKIEMQVQDYPERDCELVRKIQAILYSEDISNN